MTHRFTTIAAMVGLGLVHFSLVSVAQPVATTLAATGIGPTNATLHGTANPNGTSSLALFTYGPGSEPAFSGGFVALPATSATLTLPGFTVNDLHGRAGSVWAQSLGPTNNWQSIACSADGSRLAAVIGGNSSPGGGIFISTNSGASWTQTTAPTAVWEAIASSADGMHLAAVAYNTNIFTSADGGATWTVTSAPKAFWDSISCSADGTNLAATVKGGAIFTSTNAGTTWTQTSAPETSWQAIASSADGVRLVAAAFQGSVYISTNGGNTWAATTLTSGRDWTSVTCSANGLRMAATDQLQAIWVSTDGGTTWTQAAAAPYKDWTAIACSADGSLLAAAGSGAGIYISSDFGISWTQTSAPVDDWHSLVCSADDSVLAATVNAGGSAYVSSGPISPLTPATTYSYTLILLNSEGGAAGSLLTFTTSPGLPVVTTLPVSDVSGTSATLNGTASSSGADTSVYFQYGRTTSYGSYSATNTLTAATNTMISVSDVISGLAAGITYHFRLVARNSFGTTVGGDLTFVAIAQPIVVSSSASALGTNSADLYGTVNPDGASTVAYFQYGLTAGYGSFSQTNTLPATNVNVALTNLISNLTPVSIYHFQLVASNGAGVTLGNDETVMIPAAASVTTLPVTGLTQTDAILNATVNPNFSATSVFFQYGATTNYGSDTATIDLPATNIVLSVASLLSGLVPGTVYHYRLIALNSVGLTIGDDVSFTPLTSPAVTTMPASSVTSTNATLNGTVNPWGASTAAYFQYGLTTNYDNLGGFVALPPMTNALSLPGLTVNASYGATVTNWTLALNSTDNWNSVASSADGSSLAVTATDGGIYTSSNSGSTWTQTSAPTNANWAAIASSADGKVLAAAVAGGGIFVSTNGGAGWVLTSAPDTNWCSIALSADGSRLAAVGGGSTTLQGGIFTSADGGITWTQTTAPSANWSSIASSADGTRLAAASGGAVGLQEYLYTSTNSGATWTQCGAPRLDWNSIASSVDGMRLVAAENGYIYGSTNGGATWALMPAAPNADWLSIASSADGTRLVAAAYAKVYTSTNSGSTWTQTTVPFEDWTAAASSADGTRVTAVSGSPSGFTGEIYIGAASTNYLTPGTTYHFRAVALNDAGLAVGGDLTFTTPAALPVVTTLAAESIGATNVTLNGTINPGNAYTVGYFQYGLTTNYGSDSSSFGLNPTNATLSLSNVITGLTPGATYHFQLVAFNGAGSSAGSDMQFTTLVQAMNFSLSGAARLANGSFQFSFTNLSGLSFTVLSTTNLALPLTNWTILGTATEGPSGDYQFTDTQATKSNSRYYMVRSP